MTESRAEYVARKQRENEAYRRRVEAAEAARAAGPLDRSDAAKRLAGEAGSVLGLGPGVARGAFDFGRDAVAAVNFAGRLMDPYDADYSPPGQAAWDDVLRAGKTALDYVVDRGRNPSRLADDLSRVRVGANVPPLYAKPAPVAPTVAGEFRKQFGAGENVGEALFNVGALISGAAEFRSIPELRALSRGAAAADYLPGHATQQLADYMATPYSGMGSHAPIRRSAKLPGGKPVPKRILDSPFNRKMPPEGAPRGAFYRYHYAIDPSYYGGPVSGAFGGGGWSGRKLGWTKYGPVARAWYGTPGQTKFAGYLTLAGAGLGPGLASAGNGGR